MTDDAPEQTVSAPDPNLAFYDKATHALRELFEKAKAAHELHFAMALMPEMRGAQDAGWNTAHEAVRAFDEYTGLLELLDTKGLVRVRVLLAFYMHASECSGFYEIPKKMMLTVDGRGNNIYPFQSLVKKHRKTGQAIDPNANRIMKDLMGHAWTLGLRELSEVFGEAFDTDVRNAIAHANYTLAAEGMRLPRRNGGQVRIISWVQLDAIMSRGLNLFSLIRHLSDEYAQSYHPPKTIKSRLVKNEPLRDYTIYYNPDTQAFGFKSAERSNVSAVANAG
jgi:hypothetical protein